MASNPAARHTDKAAELPSPAPIGIYKFKLKVSIIMIFLFFRSFHHIAGCIVYDEVLELTSCHMARVLALAISLKQSFMSAIWLHMEKEYQ